VTELSDVERKTIRARVQSLLDGPFKLLGAFVRGLGCDLNGLVLLDVQGSAFDQFYARLTLPGAPESREDLEPIRAFLREVETKVIWRLRGVVWAPHDPPVSLADTVRLICGDGETAGVVIEVDRERDTITLQRIS